MKNVTKNGINFTYNNGLFSFSLNGYIFLQAESFGTNVSSVHSAPYLLLNCSLHAIKNANVVKNNKEYSTIIIILSYTKKL